VAELGGTEGRRGGEGTGCRFLQSGRTGRGWEADIT